jgi:hypothetical protein
VFWSEAIQSIRAAWRLALFDRSAIADFNLTMSGFSRSFLVYVFLAPVYLLIMLMVQQTAEIPVETLITAKLVSYVLRIASTVVVAAFLCHLLRVGDRFVTLIVATNWATVLQLGLWFVTTFAVSRGLPGGKAADLLQMSVTIALLFYVWFITRTALEVGVLAAVGIVAADLLSSELIGAGIDRLFGIPLGVVNS